MIFADAVAQEAFGIFLQNISKEGCPDVHRWFSECSEQAEAEAFDQGTFASS